jgi:hypothetical protein
MSLLAGLVEIVSAEGVPRVTLLAAECALDVACRDLALARPEVRWFREYRARLGFVHPQEHAVYLWHGLSAAEAFEVALHEARHVWQAVHAVYSLASEAAERDAREFTERMMRQRYPGVAAGFRTFTRLEAR